MSTFLSYVGLNACKLKHREREIYVIHNPDGTPRWMWNADNKNPDFLKFYAISNSKARLFSLFVKLVFAMRLQRLFFSRKSFSVKADENHPLQEYTVGNFALFTGTAGPNRKLVLFAKNQFIKIALQDASAQLIENEKKVLQKIPDGKHFIVPKVTEINSGTIALSNIGHNLARTNNFTKVHAMALAEMTNKYVTEKHIFKYSESFQNAMVRVDKIRSNRHAKIPTNILTKLATLAKEISDNQLFFSPAHGDFTPWNCFLSEDKLHIYDFELAKESAPYGFDAFHFVMQQGILVDRLPWKQLKPKLEEAFNKLILHTAIHPGRWEAYFKAYLLVNLSYYFEVYNNQKAWHIQIYWLLNTWNDALSDLLQTERNQRALLIGDVFDFLQDESYAAIKFPNINPLSLSEDSDIDLLAKRQTADRLLFYLKRHSLVRKVRYQKQSHMTSLLIVANNGSILALDLIWQLKRKSLEFMSTVEALEHAEINDFGIKVLNKRDTQRYLQCFYGLNHSEIPERFSSYFDSLEAMHFDINTLKAEIVNLPVNSGFSSFRNKWNYGFDVIKRLFKQRGVIITFSGVDGAGKSTIIEHTKHKIEKKLRKKVSVIRHRPSLLPILSSFTHGKAQAEQKAANSLPRQGTNNSFISSLFRFCYYYMDYLFGQFYVYFFYVLRGEVVLYDRYYFDFINDSLRSNIRLPKWLTKAGYRLLMPPNLNFFLYADTQTILSRKQELKPEAIETLTKDYLQLFDELGQRDKDKYFPIENVDLEATLLFILGKVKLKLT